MSGTITPWYAGELQKLFFDQSYVPAYTQVEMALVKNMALVNANTHTVDEPVGNGYSRSDPLTLDGTSFSLDVNFSVQNSAAFSWAARGATGDWGLVYGWALFTVEASKHICAYGTLSVPRRFISGMIPTGAANSVRINLLGT